MARVRSFPPLSSASAHTLILGTMPGTASLRVREYYAHPRNAFWGIAGAMLGFDPDLPYPMRCARLIDAGFAVWDVLRSCERPGSLDASIEGGSVVANDFRGFLSQHPRVARVFFNGSQAEALYRRHVLGTFEPRAPLTFMRLPSTSPAHASLSFAAKARVWHAALSVPSEYRHAIQASADRRTLPAPN